MLKTTVLKLLLLQPILHGEAATLKWLLIITLATPGHGEFLPDGEDILITDGVTLDMDGVVIQDTHGEDILITDMDTDGATLVMDGAVIQDIGEDLPTDIIIMPIIMEEEVLLLITAVEITPQTEITLTEATVIEITPIETSPTEVILTTEIAILLTDANILTSEEVLLQMAEQQQIQLLQTEATLNKDKITAMIILTEDQAVQQPETTITRQTAAQQEVTLRAHHVL